MAGWFKIWRKIEDNISWSRGLEYRGLMFTILQKARWKDSHFCGHPVKPGQFGTYQGMLADELRISRIKCLRMLKKLQEDGFITVENMNNRFSLITLVNWEIYQGKEDVPCTTDEQPENNQCTTGEHQVNTDKEGKKEESLSSSGDQTDENDTSSKSSTQPVPYNAIVDLYHEVLPELPQVRMLNQKRKSAIKARWLHSDKSQDLGYWKRFFGYVRKSSFLMGEKTDFKASIDFLFTESKFIKIIEGQYHE